MKREPADGGIGRTASLASSEKPDDEEDEGEDADDLDGLDGFRRRRCSRPSFGSAKSGKSHRSQRSHRTVRPLRSHRSNLSNRRGSAEWRHDQEEIENLEEANDTLVQQCRAMEDALESMHSRLMAAESERDALLAQRRGSTCSAPRAHSPWADAACGGGGADAAAGGSLGLAAGRRGGRPLGAGDADAKRGSGASDQPDGMRILEQQVESLRGELDSAHSEARTSQKRLAELQVQAKFLQMEVRVLQQDRDVAVETGVQLQLQIQELRSLRAARRRSSDICATTLSGRRVSGFTTLAAELDFGAADSEASTSPVAPVVDVAEGAAAAVFSAVGHRASVGAAGRAPAPSAPPRRTSAATPRLAADAAAAAEEVASLRTLVKELDGELAAARQQVADLELQLRAAREATAGDGSPAEDAAAAAEDASARRIRRFGSWDPHETRKRARARKERMKTWAEEAEDRIQPGAVLKVSRTIRYKYSKDPKKHYELSAGLVGHVASVDSDGDAKVMWEGVGLKWLLRADFYKVIVQEPGGSPEATAADDAEGADGVGRSRSKPVHRREQRRDSTAESIASSWWSVATSDVASLADLDVADDPSQAPEDSEGPGGDGVGPPASPRPLAATPRTAAAAFAAAGPAFSTLERECSVRQRLSKRNRRKAQARERGVTFAEKVASVQRSGSELGA